MIKDDVRSKFFTKFNNLNVPSHSESLSYCTFSLADFVKGGAHKFFGDFADVVKRSQASKASKYLLGSRAHLRALKTLAFLTLKYAFSHFSWYFFFKLFNIHLCGWITKYLFQYERFWTFWEMQFSFSLSETIKSLVFSLTFVCWNITL